MQLYMEQKMFSFKQDFDVFDEDGQPVYHVEGKMFSFGRQMTIYDAKTHSELAFIKQKTLAWLQTLDIFRNGQLEGSVTKKFSLFKPQYDIKQLGWKIEGDVWGYDYQILDDEGYLIASINKKVWSWSDAFEINIYDDEDYYVDPVIVMAVVIAIDVAKDNS
ncbi:LURP-one-related/scramblase family protein [Fundicoccus culcitae]|uniref:LURP-one-related family protein n=1 Tax=Fundicoccus culcitae TaxID=2969821 RepID=A0ABY5P564_9LACT|nr:LURP-one-related family protein [Fundicoccus culcitae]UUX33620.1 LURP-one-related family protein [Fundicoccus culcitae]